MTTGLFRPLEHDIICKFRDVPKLCLILGVSWRHAIWVPQPTWACVLIGYALIGAIHCTSMTGKTNACVFMTGTVSPAQTVQTAQTRSWHKLCAQQFQQHSRFTCQMPILFCSETIPGCAKESSRFVCQVFLFCSVQKTTSADAKKSETNLRYVFDFKQQANYTPTTRTSSL